MVKAAIVKMAKEGLSLPSFDPLQPPIKGAPLLNAVSSLKPDQTQQSSTDDLAESLDNARQDPIAAEVKFQGDFESIVGDKESLFMDEVNAALASWSPADECVNTEMQASTHHRVVAVFHVESIMDNDTDDFGAWLADVRCCRLGASQALQTIEVIFETDGDAGKFLPEAMTCADLVMLEACLGRMISGNFPGAQGYVKVKHLSPLLVSMQYSAYLLVHAHLEMTHKLVLDLPEEWGGAEQLQLLKVLPAHMHTIEFCGPPAAVESMSSTLNWLVADTWNLQH